jgi:hypothetical protein
MKTILASCAVIGICWSPGYDLKTGDYFGAINDDKAPIVQKVKNIEAYEFEPHAPQTSIVSSLISQIETCAKITAIL